MENSYPQYMFPVVKAISDKKDIDITSGPMWVGNICLCGRGIYHMLSAGYVLSYSHIKNTLKFL
jgi:hypothetical protein